MILGIGTGSTVDQFIAALKDRKIQLEGAVSSSRATSARLEAAGIPETGTELRRRPAAVHRRRRRGDRRRQLIKGGGAALTREKVVAAASKRFVCIIDERKLVDVLGKFPLPVEVIPMARSYVARRLLALGGQPVWREGVVTDNGNVILDVHNLRLIDPKSFETAVNQIAGVVTVGLFAQRGADELIVGADAGVRRIVP